jgi:hypothetical protein
MKCDFCQCIKLLCLIIQENEINTKLLIKNIPKKSIAKSLIKNAAQVKQSVQNSDNTTKNQISLKRNIRQPSEI